MNQRQYELAAVLASGDPHTLYSGLSLLVSAAVDDGPCAALASFGALELLVADGDALDDFARSFAELKRTALELENLTIWACAASARSIATDLPVLSTPRFLRETAAARRLIHV